MADDSRKALIERIQSFKHGHYPFELGNGVGIRHKYADKKEQLRHFIWPAVLKLCGGSLKRFRVLDVGCNAGFWSLEAHRSGAAYVLGVDVRPVHIEQAELVRDALGIPSTQLEFRQMNIYDLSREELGQFDLCILLRVLHHLNQPLVALEKIRQMCRSFLVIDIKLVCEEQPVFRPSFENVERPLHGTDGFTVKPSRSALELMLTQLGFTEVTLILPDPPVQKYLRGRRGLFTARVAE
jgi:tRNA (mo5U34)-methyltransferase